MRLNVRARDGYVNVNLYRDGEQITEKVHRLVCSTFHGHRSLPWEPDHLNGERSDNRVSNLKWKTSSQNGRNRTVAKGRSGVVGVFASDSKIKPWKSYVTVNYKKIYVGAFSSIEEASAAREKFVARLDG